MQSKALTPEAYIESLPEDRRAALEQLRTVLKENLPAGFEEVMGYGMLGYVVPHSLYPAGYHCDPKQPLPFINVASQKNHIAIYHMGLYMTGELLDWFVAQWETVSRKKLDMGKSCIRFKKPEDIPYGLIGELATKLTPEQWIASYEKVLNR
ncbi:DUF1801 domain-containing protein [bacterium]|nr:DUF1801 domain-containing protein [bacterium]